MYKCDISCYPCYRWVDTVCQQYVNWDKKLTCECIIMSSCVNSSIFNICLIHCLPKIDYLFVTWIHPIQSIASKMMTKLRKTWILHISRVEFYSDIQQSSIEKSWMLILLFYAFSLFNRFIIVNFLERLETRFLNKIYKIILVTPIHRIDCFLFFQLFLSEIWHFNTIT